MGKQANTSKPQHPPCATCRFLSGSVFGFATTLTGAPKLPSTAWGMKMDSGESYVGHCEPGL